MGYIFLFIFTGAGVLVLYLKTGSTGYNINPTQLKRIAVLNEDKATIGKFNELIGKIETTILCINKEVDGFFSNFETLLVKT